MDILYISPKTETELTRYCETELLIAVLEHFANNGKVIEKMDDDIPNRERWIITGYILDHTIDSRKKLAVILSFASIGGNIVQIGDRQEIGDVNVLCMLKELYYISEEDFDYFVEAFYNFSHGNGAKFT